jgi:hypothetical protein
MTYGRFVVSVAEQTNAIPGPPANMTPTDTPGVSASTKPWPARSGRVAVRSREEVSRAAVLDRVNVAGTASGNAGQTWCSSLPEAMAAEAQRSRTFTQTGSSGPVVDGMTSPLATYAQR